MTKLKLSIIFYITLTFFYINSSKSQNILANPDFESGDSGYPDDLNQFNHLDYWQRMDRQSWSHPFGTTHGDWYGPDYLFSSDNQPPYTQAQSGTHYVGIYDCEGGCQPLGNNLSKNSYVRYSFYHFAKQSWQDSRYYLAKKKLVIRHNCEGISLGWFGAQKIQLLGGLIVFPNSAWNYYQSGYIIVNNGDYDWFGFKGGETQLIDGENGNQREVPYALYDKFTLENETCLPTCEATSGGIHATSSGVHSEQQPWYADNLNNVSGAYIEIWKVNGVNFTSSFTVSSINGITNPIYWNGKNASGSEASSGTYIAKMTLSNSCETKQVNFQFEKQNGAGSNTTPPPVPLYNNTGIHTPRPCCVQDIYLSNMTIHGPGRLEYKVNGNIYLGPNLTFASDCDVLLQPEGDVLDNGGYTTIPGAKVEWKPEPCNQRSSLDLTLHADFAADHSNLCTNDTVKFYNTTQNAYQPVSYLWNFGNGSTSTEVEPVVIFGAADSFIVWLSVTDSLGRTDSISHPVIVNDCIDTIGFEAIVLDCPVDTFAINEFVDDSLYQSFVWDFGNGDSSALRDPLIYYSSPGIYILKVVVTDTTGALDSAYQKIVVPGCNTLRTGKNNLTEAINNSLPYSVVPNPSSGIFNFYFKKSDDKPEISIYDITGRTVLQFSDIKENFLKLDLTGYSKGAYLTKIKIGEKVYFDKLIIN